MKTKHFYGALCALMIMSSVVSCNKDDDNTATDTEKPTFNNTGATPIDGEKFLPGDIIRFHQVFCDNVELGAFNIEIHNNFDGHSHSTETNSKHESNEHGDVENAWVFNQDYEIPSGSKSYTADILIPIPADIAEGDYHFMIRVTDKAGWQEIKAVSLEIED